MRYCTYCGSEASYPGNFCGKCGGFLHVSETSLTALTAQASDTPTEEVALPTEKDDDEEEKEIQGIILVPEGSAPDVPTVPGTPLETSVPMTQGATVTSAISGTPSTYIIAPSAPIGQSELTPIVSDQISSPIHLANNDNSSSTEMTQSGSSVTQPATPEPQPPPPPTHPPYNLNWWDQIINFFKSVANKFLSALRHIFAKGISFHLAGLPALSLGQLSTIVLTVLIVSSVAAYAIVNNTHFSLLPFNLYAARTTPSVPRSVPPKSTSGSSATVSIVPVSKTQQETYTITAITGNPNGAKRQVFAHTVTATSAAVSETVSATGQGQTQGTQATGIITISNSDPNYPITFEAGSRFANNNANGITVVLDATVYVPTASGNGNGIATVSVHVLQFGTVGNIPSQTAGGNGFDFYCDPSVSNCAPFSGYQGPYELYNTTPFTGGTDPQSYTFVQQSDIDNAANALISTNTPNAQQVLQGQLKPNERLIGSPQCKPQTSANQSAGDQVSQVTVTVSFTCSGEVYDYNGALALAQYLLKQHMQHIYSTYALAGNITTTMQSATLSDTGSSTVTMVIQASGQWVAQFDAKSEQALAQAIAGKKVSVALTLLESRPDIEKASIQLQGGNSDILPTNPAQIKFTIAGK